MRRIIVRGDDCGANRASTYGILKCAEAELLRNVSFMAVGNEIETAAEVFRGRSDVCMGFHFTIFSEWDRVKWKPVSPVDQIRTLLNENEEFYQGPQCWRSSGVPETEEIRREWNAQLDRLAALGLNITYGDTHMFPELFSAELFSEMKKWYWQKGLLDHRNYYHPLPNMEDMSRLKENKWSELAQSQYFFLAHPSDPNETDSGLYGNAEISGDEVRKQREDEYRFLTDPEIKRKWQQAGIKSITYREARPLGQNEGDERWPE